MSTTQQRPTNQINYVPQILTSQNVTLQKQTKGAKPLFSPLEGLLNYDATWEYIEVLQRASETNNGWIVDSLDRDLLLTSASDVAEFVVTPNTLGSITAIYFPSAPLQSIKNEDIDEEEYLSFSDFLSLEEQVYQNLVARKKAARAAEAAYWETIDSDVK